MLVKATLKTTSRTANTLLNVLKGDLLNFATTSRFSIATAQPVAPKRRDHRSEDGE